MERDIAILRLQDLSGVVPILLKTAEGSRVERDRTGAKLDPIGASSEAIDGAFYDFDEYERLLEAAKELGPAAHLVTLLGGEAGGRDSRSGLAPAR